MKNGKHVMCQPVAPKGTRGANGNTGKGNSLSEEELFSACAPGMQHECCKGRWRCVMGASPRLSEVCRQLGEETAIKWMTEQLYDLARHANCRYELSDFQFKEMARLALQDYSRLKLTEVMLFFNDCKSGKHAKLYGGHIDPMRLMAALREFVAGEIPGIMAKWREGNEDGESLAGVHAGRARCHGLSGEAAREARGTVPKGEPGGDELGDIAREVGERLVGLLATVCAERAGENDCAGEVGKAAEVTARATRDNNAGNHFQFGGLAMRVSSILEESREKQCRKMGELGERGEITAGKHVTLEECLLVKVKSGDSEGAYGNAARKKAEVPGKSRDGSFWLCLNLFNSKSLEN